MKKLVLGASILIFLFCGTNALANSMGFEDIVVGDFDLSDKFTFDVVAGNSADTVKFVLHNNSEDPSIFIGGVFWDFGGLLEAAPAAVDPFDGGTGDVDFSYKKNQDAKNLPQSENLTDPFTTSYSAFRKNANKGIHSGEQATFVFSLARDLVGEDFNTVLAAIERGVRTAIHVQGVEGYGDEDSDTYIAKAPVPEPSTMLLLGVGLIGIAGLGRKKLFKKE